MIVSSKGLKMCHNKVQTIQEWLVPKKVKEVQAFIGFANIYRQFVYDYSKIAMPFTNSTRKDQSFVWTPHTELAFKELRSKFLQTSVFIHPNFERPFVVETDAFDIATGGILSQYGEDEQLHYFVCIS